jgi:8-oxo-dGTP pyrophosphatase MutT (NUDIX family)
LSLILTRRADDLRDHPGQISFPGGRIEALDADVPMAALREAREEIGLDPARVTVLGCLPPQPVITGFAISPVVGLILPGSTLTADATEVAEIFEVPLHFISDPRNQQIEQRVVGGTRWPMVSYQYGPYRIWGATGQILASLSEVCDDAGT